MSRGTSISIRCPNCQRKFAAPGQAGESQAVCPACHKAIRIPSAPPADPPPTAAAQIDFVERKDPANDAPLRAREPGGEFVDPDSAPVLAMVQRTISEAFRLGASRILILPVENRVKLAYRIHDAVCQRANPPRDMLHPVLVKLMTMANFAGAIKVHLGGKERRLQMAFKPTRHGLSALIEIPQETPPLAAYRAHAAKLGYRFVHLPDLEIPAPVLAMVPQEVAREYTVLPVAVDGDTISVATSDPRAEDMLARLRFILNHPIVAVMASEGAILAAIDRHYGPTDPETADLLLWEIAQTHAATPAAPAAPAVKAQPWSTAPAGVQTVVAHLRTLCRESMFEMFDRACAGAGLCHQDPATGHLDVVFSQSNLISALPAKARRYVEDKIWALREAIASRLENYVETDYLARGLAMTYSQYLACRRCAEQHNTSINPATARDAWINFLYWLVLDAFPTIDSNGTLLAFVRDHLDQLAQRVAELIGDPALVVDPGHSRDWLTRLERQTTTDDALDYESPPIIHLVELLIAEGLQLRASRIAILPAEDCVQVAYRVQRTIYDRNPLPLSLLYPILARLMLLAEPSGRLSLTIGRQKRNLGLELRLTPQGLAALVEVVPDATAVQACQAQAAKHGFPFMTLSDVEVRPAVLALVPQAVARKKRVLPLAVQGETLTVALSEPPNARRLDEFRLVFNRPISIVLAPEDDLIAAIHRHYHPPAPGAVSLTASLLLEC